MVNKVNKPNLLHQAISHPSGGDPMTPEQLVRYRTDMLRVLNTKIVTLDDQNYGKPPENSGLHGWVDKKENYYYTQSTMLRIAELLGRTVPSIDELVASIERDPDRFHTGVGYRSSITCDYYGGDYSCYLSGSMTADGKPIYAILGRGARIPDIEYTYPNKAFPFRFIQTD